MSHIQGADKTVQNNALLNLSYSNKTKFNR